MPAPPSGPSWSARSTASRRRSTSREAGGWARGKRTPGPWSDFMGMLWTGVAALARVAIWLGGAMIFAAAAIVTAEVLLRKGVGALFGTGFVFSGSDEISAYLFRAGTSWSRAYGISMRGHCPIDPL